jgi:hypothetical protein
MATVHDSVFEALDGSSKSKEKTKRKCHFANKSINISRSSRSSYSFRCCLHVWQVA